jgi:NADPH-dependent 2,4-dienoyl-CoA reductase/sulfur reductase-like enzyme
MDLKDFDPAVRVSVQVFHLYAQKLLDRFHSRKLGFSIPDTIPVSTGTGPAAKLDIPDLPLPKPITRLAIIGAGVAGLYTAMILKEKGHEFDIDILEASERVGGRLYTHRFDNKSDIGTPAPGGEYDYFVSVA